MTKPFLVATFLVQLIFGDRIGLTVFFLYSCSLVLEVCALFTRVEMVGYSQ